MGDGGSTGIDGILSSAPPFKEDEALAPIENENNDEWFVLLPLVLLFAALSNAEVSCANRLDEVDNKERRLLPLILLPLPGYMGGGRYVFG
jgi:hypothetical protein